MNNKILAIAITDYDDKKLDNLSNCKNDLDNIIKVLEGKYQFDDIDYLKHQTPTFGPLSNVGHAGGIFFLKLKENLYETPQNLKNLKEKYGSLYLPIIEKHREEFDKLKLVAAKKQDAVKKQDYLKARKLKDEEEEIRRTIPKSFISNFKTLNNDYVISIETKKTIKEYDEKILKFKTQLPIIKKEFKKELSKFSEHSQVYIGSKIYTTGNVEELLEAYVAENLKETNYINYFIAHKKELIINFSTSLLNLYKFFKSIQGNSNSVFFKKKEEELLEIYENIYESEINFLHANSIDEIEFLIIIKNNELKLLNWIQYKVDLNVE